MRKELENLLTSLNEDDKRETRRRFSIAINGSVDSKFFCYDLGINPQSITPEDHRTIIQYLVGEYKDYCSRKK